MGLKNPGEDNQYWFLPEKVLRSVIKKKNSKITTCETVQDKCDKVLSDNQTVSEHDKDALTIDL